MIKTSASRTEASGTASDRRSLLGRLQETVEHAAHLLPAQGPITVFIHHNTLHAFEDLPFEEAAKEALRIFGCQVYLPEDQYREALRRGRIRYAELKRILETDLAESARQRVPCFGTRLDLRMAMLHDPLHTGPPEELLWHVAEADALRRMRPEVSATLRARFIAETRRWVMRDLRGGDESRPGGSVALSENVETETARTLRAMLNRVGRSIIENWNEDDWEGFALQALWRVCHDGVRRLDPPKPRATDPKRHRDLLWMSVSEDSDLLVNSVLIRFVAAFLDQGLAARQMPLRDEGLFRAFCALYSQPWGPPNRWLRGLSRELRSLTRRQLSPLQSVLESLEILGVPANEWSSYIETTLLALSGWAGMVHQIELRGDRVVQPVPAGSLVEFLAVRLLLDRLAISYIARHSLGYSGTLSRLRAWIQTHPTRRGQSVVEQRALLVFQLVQLIGLSPDVLVRLRQDEWAAIVDEIEAFGEFERRRVFHLAYEHRLSVQALDAIGLHAWQHHGRPESPAFQVACCLDEREESFRRHLEELAPNVETFGAAGFYSVAMYYRGAADAHFTPLCPVILRPEHWVVEEVDDGHLEAHHRWRAARRALGSASFWFHRGSRSVAAGAILTGAIGVLATFPLVARVMFPRLTARIRRSFGHIVQPPLTTRLRIERSEGANAADGHAVGFSIEEMASSAERLLRDIGFISGFARLVLLLGHGSDSCNNPYNSAYNCGACGGAAGGPNARAMAQILNDARVRALLARRGISISSDTLFVGGYHNTCNETVTFYDLAHMPQSHREAFRAAQQIVEAACDRNAHERCRRFMSAPLTLSLGAARVHVEQRSEDLAETRPELGHATNALTIVGRREWSRGLFLDRRAFLTSYDPTQDDEDGTILTGILNAVFPVCAGISLEYFFSRVDNAGFGSGTKLPQNLASLVGVMDGAASDLRTGLPWQMVEIHEPVRSLFVIETTPDTMTRIMNNNEAVHRLCHNRWIQLAVLHPLSRQLYVFQDGQFELYQPQASSLPKAPSSVDWYRGWRDHLEFSQIEG